MRIPTLLGFLLALAPAISTSAPATENPRTRVDRLFAAFHAPVSPGCSVGVLHGGALVHRGSYGAASLELGVPLSEQSVFYVASVSKQFTAASIVLAAEQGFLSLDESVRKYLPELPAYAQPVTLRQLLHQRSSSVRPRLRLPPSPRRTFFGRSA